MSPARVEARTRLGAAVERAIHLVEQLLALARSEPQEAAVRIRDTGFERPRPPKESRIPMIWRSRATSI